MDEYERFKQEVVEKLGDLTPQQWREQHPGQHLYARYRQYESCALCGRVKPRGRKPKPCPGIVKIGLRNTA